ncbi:DUF1254 domain-containing protein [Streptomyces sp. NPDC013171]|uniref:DUF1254 domain-containing protein n=1 Tax=Streptomyces sp. NPDC013171 TaxID=3364863 RepID=UPI0036C52468
MRGTRAAGAVDNESAQILVARPLHVGFTLNSDTPYPGSGLDLRKGGPLVIELPAVPLVGLLDDHYHRWLVDLGLPGRNGPRGGKVLLLPAGHEGELPPESEGYEVVRSDTWQVLRALPLSGDADAANRLLAVDDGRCGDGGGVVPGRFRSGRRGPPPPSAGQDRTIPTTGQLPSPRRWRWAHRTLLGAGVVPEWCDGRVPTAVDVAQVNSRSCHTLAVRV